MFHIDRCLTQTRMRNAQQGLLGRDREKVEGAIGMVRLRTPGQFGPEKLKLAAIGFVSGMSTNWYRWSASICCFIVFLEDLLLR